ncbi:hypothetical protein FAM19022_001802 [Propionibacterium freudenreichii]|uniref:hypothetical protein n=1 Tax=Propionibacterium freudenreichii TaxID=1744 RepID=UPI002550D375|nr:hypothetical protein [Propionibacterium freudenreichii]MDK9646983.1 hypothetical protein [Propionibacterium freudenreichii]
MSGPPVYTTQWIITCRSCGKQIGERRGRGRWTKKGPQLPPGEPEVIRRTVVLPRGLCESCELAQEQLEELVWLLEINPEGGPSVCFRCGRTLSNGLRADTHYCSNACRQAMYRIRRTLASGRPMRDELWRELLKKAYAALG